VYTNEATNNDVIAGLYIIATCGSLLFSKIKSMVVGPSVTLRRSEIRDNRLSGRIVAVTNDKVGRT
jgi:hypothetical protein